MKVALLIGGVLFAVFMVLTFVLYQATKNTGHEDIY